MKHLQGRQLHHIRLSECGVGGGVEVDASLGQLTGFCIGNAVAIVGLPQFLALFGLDNHGGVGRLNHHIVCAGRNETEEGSRKEKSLFHTLLRFLLMFDFACKDSAFL